MDLSSIFIITYYIIEYLAEFIAVVFFIVNKGNIKAQRVYEKIGFLKQSLKD